MANVTFIRGNTSKIDGTPVADGQLLFDTDKKTLQMDNGTTRENFAGAVASNVSVDNSTMKVVKTNTVQSAIQDLDTNASNTSNIVSDAWTSRSYEVGEYAISDNKLWKCLVKNSVKPSESANWTEVSVGGEISQVNSNLSDVIVTDSNLFSGGVGFSTTYRYPNGVSRLTHIPIIVPVDPAGNIRQGDGTMAQNQRTFIYMGNNGYQLYNDSQQLFGAICLIAFIKRINY